MVKALRPSMKEKKRYVAFEMISQAPVRFADAQRSIQNAVHEFLGISGSSKLGIRVMDIWKNQKGVIRVGHRFVDELKASLCFVRVQGKEVICRSLGTSGIMKKTVQRYLS